MSKTKGMLVISFILVLISCAPKSISLPLQQVSSSEATRSSEPSWQDRWENLIKASRAETKVVLYSTARPLEREAIGKDFYNKFGIRTEFLSGRGEELISKMKRERSADLYLADIMISGSTSMITRMKPEGLLDPLKPLLILPEVVDPDVWWQGKLPWVDKEERYVFPTTASPSSSLIINESLVREGDIKSYYDILESRWQGKVALIDPTIASAGSRQMFMLAESIVNYDYLKKLAGIRPQVTRDERLLGEWLSQGKYAIAFGLGINNILPFVEAGAPLRNMTPLEGTYISSGGTSLVLINRAPHPDASKVFVNWFLSKEGQTTYTKSYLAQSARVDVPTDFLPEFRIRKERTKYFNYEDEDVILKEPAFLQKARELFGPLLK